MYSARNHTNFRHCISATKNVYMHRIIFVLSTTGVVYLIFFFFYKKILSVKNTHKQKPTNKTKTSKQKTTEATTFVCGKTSKGVKTVFFILHRVLFVHIKSFCLKKNRFEIVSIASIHYTTDVYYPQPTYEEFIHTHLFFNLFLL